MTSIWGLPLASPGGNSEQQPALKRDVNILEDLSRVYRGPTKILAMALMFITGNGLDSQINCIISKL